MKDYRHTLKRAHLQQICAFFMDEIDLDGWYEEEDHRPYEQRRREEERPIWQLLHETFPDSKDMDEATDKLCRALVVNQRIYMEIGVKAGAALLYELLWDHPDEACGREKADGEE